MALAQSKEGRGSSHGRGGIVSEARTGKRFPLELPIKIHKDDSSSDSKGITGNLTAAADYIRADASLEMASPVEFEITLPPHVTAGKTNLTIHCKTRLELTNGAG